MQIVIDISDKDYQLMKDGHVPFIILDKMRNGTPLTEKPKGKWIYKTRIKGNPYIYECSVCNECHRDSFKYCPNCGAYMSGGEEDENNSGC